jgi:hypothetical protein
VALLCVKKELLLSTDCTPLNEPLEHLSVLGEAVSKSRWDLYVTVIGVQSGVADCLHNTVR